MLAMTTDVKVPLRIGYSRQATYLSSVLPQLFRLAFPWTNITIESMPSNTPHIFVSTVLDGGCGAYNYDDECIFGAQYYARHYR